MTAMSFRSEIDQPIRNRGFGSATLLDHVWLNMENYDMSGILEVDITDHFPVFVSFPILAKRSFRKKYFRDHSMMSIELLKLKVEQFVQSFLSEEAQDVDSRLEYFMNKFKIIYDECCPIRCKTKLTYQQIFFI